MSIAKKMFIAFGIIVLILIGVSGFSVAKLMTVDDEYSFLISDNAYKVIETMKVENAVSLQGVYIRSYMLYHNSKDLDNLDKQREMITKTMDEVGPLFKVAEMKEKVQSIKEKQALYSGYVDEIVQYVDNNQMEEAHNILANFAIPTNQSIQQSINDIVDFQTEKMNASSADITTSANTSEIFLIVISLVGIIISISLAIWMTRNITIPLNHLTKSAHVMATGDLHEEDIVVNTKDEIRELAQAFNTMKSSLVTLISHVSLNVSNTTAVAEQLAASMDEVAVSTGDIAKRMEKVASGGSQAAAIGNECAIATEETAQGVGRIADAAQLLSS